MPKTESNSCSFVIVIGRSMGPFWNGPAIAPALTPKLSALPTVRSTSLTNTPGETRATAIFFSEEVSNSLKIIYKKGFFENPKQCTNNYQSGYDHLISFFCMFLLVETLFIVHSLHS